MPNQKNNFFIDSDKLSEAALAKKHRLETEPSSRTDPMAYWPDMEQIDPTDFSAHDDWLALMMACHHATAGEGRQ